MTITPEKLNSLLEAVRRFAHENLNCRSISEAEEQIQGIMRAVSNAMMGEVAEKMNGKATYKGVRIGCECGKEAGFVGYRNRWVKTLHGDVEVSRAYYHCHECKRGQIPWDAGQGLDERVWTSRVKELVASTCAALPYEAASRLIERTTGLAIEESSEEEIMRDVGERLRQGEGEVIGVAVDVGQEIPCRGSPERLYISMDVAKAHTGGEWHDVKVGAVYECKRPEGGETDTLINPRYAAAQEKSEDFGRRVYTRAMQAGYDGAKERIVIGSGPVEPACKVMVAQRLKQAGMRWTKDGADAVLAVRVALLSAEYDRIEHAARAA